MSNERYQDEGHEEPAFIISVAARMLGVHAQTLRYYERVGLIIPSRSRGRIRLYSRADLERVRQVQGLIDKLGVNLAGAEDFLVRGVLDAQPALDDIAPVRARATAVRQARAPRAGRRAADLTCRALSVTSTTPLVSC